MVLYVCLLIHIYYLGFVGWGVLSRVVGVKEEIIGKI